MENIQENSNMEQNKESVLETNESVEQDEKIESEKMKNDQEIVGEEDQNLKIVHLSDTHSTFNIEGIPDGDVLIFSGDFSSYYEWVSNDRISAVLSPSVEKFDNIMSQLPHKVKLVIAGNHDVLDAFDLKEVVEKMFKNCIYLMDSTYTIDIAKEFPEKKFSEGFEKINIFGSPWNFHPGMGYGKPRRVLGKYWEEIPDETNILITHVPPFGILDTNAIGKPSGCELLLKKTKELSKNNSLRLHCFGHVHECKGIISDQESKLIYSNGSGKLRKNSSPNVLYFNLSD